MSYYRFMSIKSNLDNIIKSIKENEIWHGNAFGFNDPTDGRPHIIDPKNARSCLSSYSEDKIRRTMPSRYNEVYVPDYLRQQNDTVLADTLVNVNIQNFGIACFIKGPEFNKVDHDNKKHFIADNLTMWGYYGDSHAGICLEYDQAILDNELAMINVDYKEERPKCSCNDLTQNVTYLTTKSEFWIGENESRSIVQLTDNPYGKSKELNTQPIRNIFIGSGCYEYDQFKNLKTYLPADGDIYVSCPNRSGFYYTWQPIDIAELFHEFSVKGT